MKYNGGINNMELPTSTLDRGLFRKRGMDMKEKKNFKEKKKKVSASHNQAVQMGSLRNLHCCWL